MMNYESRGRPIESVRFFPPREFAEIMKEYDFMGKAILAAIVTIISGYYGAIIGDELLNGFVQLGSIVAVAVMGAFIICFNEKRND